MSKLRNAARGQSCMVRLPGCDGGGETTVLAHYRMAGYGGTGTKPGDLSHGAWCCWRCHELVDFRHSLDGYTDDEVRLAHAEGVMRTVAELVRAGVVKA